MNREENPGGEIMEPINMVLYAGIFTSGMICCYSLFLLAKNNRTSQTKHAASSLDAGQTKTPAIESRQPPTSQQPDQDPQQPDVTTALHKPHLLYQAKRDKEPPEKYRILRRLVDQGMDVEQIASLLEISRAEVCQLLHLNRIVQKTKHQEPKQF